MGLSILIVEDFFIEANDLRVILQRAGHTVIGIARSVDQALASLKKHQPQIVLLDIFLKGPLTGIHLAKTLSQQHIPFIYLSANSNTSTLEAAKATEPYGFLVKPYRERDVLVAIEIAGYRHRHAQEQKQRQEKWLNHLLDSIINEVATQEQKLLLLVRAFKTFVPFDHILIDTNSKSGELRTLYTFQRTGFDEYKRTDLKEFLKKARLSPAGIDHFRKELTYKRDIILRNGEEFINASYKDRLAEKGRFFFGIRSSLYLPIPLGKDNGMSISFFSVEPDSYTNEHIELLDPLRSLLATVMQSIRDQNNPQQPTQEIAGPVAPPPYIEGIVGKSPRLLHVLDEVIKVAGSDTTVLISGETGVGKEGLAGAIHQLSRRNTGPLIKVNCAAIPEGLIESELFGHEKGSFTGAAERRIGKFEMAQGGTVFLDEIGELPLGVQSKLLRVLQEKEIERIGGRSMVKIDVRIIAATNRQLHKEVAEGRFRMDLYYRINVFPIIIPPLRERIEDIPLLAGYFLQQNANLSGGKAKTLSPEALQQLMTYSWPGNIRELQHLIERHVLTNRSPYISSVELPEAPLPQAEEADISGPAPPIGEIDKDRIIQALKKCNGKVSGPGGAAEMLGINPNTLTSRMKKLGIVWQYILR